MQEAFDKSDIVRNSKMEDAEDNWSYLLGRPVVRFDPAALAAPFVGKRILVTGAGGWIGSALTKMLAGFHPEWMVVLDYAEHGLHRIHADLTTLQRGTRHTAVLGNICDAALLSEVFARHRPEIVYHAAACKHVPLMEKNPLAAVHTNAIGTYLLVQTALQYGVEQLVMLSTDKAVVPWSVMGASKRVAELTLLALTTETTRMQAVRLANVLGSCGSVVPLFRKQIAEGGPITVTDPEVRRYFLRLQESLELLLSVVQPEYPSGVFVPQLGKPIRIVDLAKFMLENEATPVGREIAIVFTGLRLGDKMNETLLSDREFLGELMAGKETPRLRRVRGPHLSRGELMTAMEDMQQCIRERATDRLLQTLLRVVPEYEPSLLLRNCAMNPVITR